MFRFSLITFIFASLFWLSAGLASAQFDSRSYEREREEAREEKAEQIEKFKHKIKKDRSAMARGLKQCDILKGSIDANAEYFIIFNLDALEDKLHDNVKEMNKRYAELREEHIQCILMSPSSSNYSQKGLKRFHAENRLRLPFIDRYTIYEKTTKYTSRGDTKRIYPIYYLCNHTSFRYSFSNRLRVYWRNADEVTDDAKNLTEALEAIEEHKKSGKHK